MKDITSVEELAPLLDEMLENYPVGRLTRVVVEFESEYMGSHDWTTAHERIEWTPK